MDSKNLTIIPPEGMEAYQEGNEIKFRPVKKKLTYENVAEELFYNKDVWRFENYAVNKYAKVVNWHYCTNCTSEKQAQKLRAINQLMNVAKYLNGGWQPNWNSYERKYRFRILDTGRLDITYNDAFAESFVYFKSEELARQAIEILGEETIKLTLSTDW